MTSPRIERGHYLSMDELVTLRVEVGKVADVSRRENKDRPKIIAQMICELALCTGGRVGELSVLTCGDIDLSRPGGETIRIQTFKKRGTNAHKAARYLPIIPPLLGLCRVFFDDKKRWGESVDTSAPLIIGKDGKPMCRKGWQLAWNRTLARYGLPKISIHGARHTFGVMLQRQTNDTRLLQSLLGHSSMDTTARFYTAISPDDMRKGMTGLSDALAEREKNKPVLTTTAPKSVLRPSVSSAMAEIRRASQQGTGQ